MAEKAKTTRKAPAFGVPDGENPEWTPEMFARARPMREVMPEVVEAMKRGRPKLAKTKVAISLRVDEDVVSGYRSLGRGWQTQMSLDLAKAIGRRVADEAVSGRRAALRKTR
jgi:uncharacterized protein (DUF4415 family)